MGVQLLVRDGALIGRAPEQAAIGALLDATDGGAALVIRGTPGVGKSALLQWAATTAAGRFRLLRATGSVTEFGLPYAALHQLLRPILRQRPGALDAGRTPDPYPVAMAALELLTEAAAERPVLILADDVHWMDPASRQVLAFLARRVTADRVILLATQRENEAGALLDPAIPSMSLAPLDANSAAQLLDRTTGELDGATRSRLLTVACGNPLALLELPRTGLTSQPPALGARLQESFLARAGGFDPATTTVLQVAAVIDTDDLSEILAAAALLPGADNVPSLDPAVSAGLIAVEDGALRFRHPLIRSALLQRLGPDRRRACHAALATVLGDQPERSLRHAAAAALRPDAALAAGLERHAGQAIARGAPANALPALDRAAQLSACPRDRIERTYRAAVLAYAVGRPDSGDRLRTRYRDLVDGEHDTLRYEWLNELGGADGGDQRIHQLVSLAARATAVADGALATDLLRAAALRCWNLRPGRPAGKEVIAAADRLGVTDVVTRAALLAYGSPFDSDATIRALIAEVPAATRDAATTYRLARAAACAGAFDLSEVLLTEAVQRLRSEGQLHILGRALSLLAWTALRRGQWAQAMAAADEGARLCAETCQPFWQAAALVAHATVAAFRGEFAAADDLVARADRVDPRRFATIEAVKLVARAATASGRGNHRQAYACLASLHDPAAAAYPPVHALWSLASLAEAAAACGEAAAARALIDELHSDVRRTASPVGRMNLDIARAVLDESFDAALATDMTVWPYERYRLLFAHGRFLRRNRRIRESRVLLRQARDGFDSLGAGPLAERAREELRAAGERSESRVPAPWESLSPQEIQIASMVAQGLSNRDIAQGLYVSHRTVGSHLSRMFPKLGITSRGELQRMAAQHRL